MTFWKWLLVALATTAVVLVGAGSIGSGRSAQGDPPYYQKRGTWWEMLIASRDAAAGSHPGVARPLPDFGKDDFTIVAWVGTTTGGTILSVAPAQGDWAPQGKTLFVRDGKLCYDIGWVATLTANTPVADGRWRQVAITGPRDYKLYVDGRLDFEGSLAAEPDVPGHIVRIGHTSPNYPDPSGFTGDLDDVRVYPNRLAGPEIAAICAAPSRPGPGPVAWWKLDGSFTDDSGNQHTARQVPQATRSQRWCGMGATI